MFGQEIRWRGWVTETQDRDLEKQDKDMERIETQILYIDADDTVCYMFFDSRNRKWWIAE